MDRQWRNRRVWLHRVNVQLDQSSPSASFHLLQHLHCLQTELFVLGGYDTSDVLRDEAYSFDGMSWSWSVLIHTNKRGA